MANESGDNISEIVNNIACELAKKKLNFKEDDKEDQSKLEQLSLEILEQQEEVQESIDGIYNTIKAQYFGILLPKGLKHEVAEYVLLQVNEKDLYSASEIEVGDATVKEILVGALQKTDEKQRQTLKRSVYGENANLSLYKHLGDIFEVDINEKREELLKLNIVFEIPDDSMYAFASKQDEEDEMIIELEKANMKHLYDLFKKYPEKRQNYLESYEEILTFVDGGLGIDSSLRFLDDVITADGADILNNDEFLRKALMLTTQAHNKGVENGTFRDDNYTILRKLSIMSNFLKNQNVDKSLPQIIQIQEALRKMDPKLYNMVENNPNILDYLKELYGNEPEEIAIKLAGSSKALDRENTLDILGNISRELQKQENSNTKEIKVEDTDKLEQEERSFTNNDKGAIKIATIPANTARYRKGIEIMLKNTSTAIPNAIRMLSSQATEDKKDVFQDVIVEKLLAEKDTPEINSPEAIDLKKKLFEIIINRSINKSEKIDSQLIERLTEIDVNAIKGVLKDSLIPLQNDKPSQLLGQYVQAISVEIKSSSPVVLDSKKTQLSKLVGTSNALLGDSQNNKRSQLEEEGQEL